MFSKKNPGALFGQWVFLFSVLLFVFPQGMSTASPVQCVDNLFAAFGNSGIDEEGSDLVVDENGIYSVGASSAGTLGNTDFQVIKLNSTGDLEYAFHIGGTGPDNDYLNALDQTDDSIIFGGYSQTVSGSTNYNLAITKAFKSTGTEDWSVFFGGSSNLRYPTIAVNSNDFYVALVDKVGAYTHRLRFMKLLVVDGSVQFDVSYDLSPFESPNVNFYEDFVYIALTENSSEDILILKVSSNDGSVQWAKKNWRYTIWNAN